MSSSWQRYSHGLAMTSKQNQAIQFYPVGIYVILKLIIYYYYYCCHCLLLRSFNVYCNLSNAMQLSKLHHSTICILFLYSLTCQQQYFLKKLKVWMPLIALVLIAIMWLLFLLHIYFFYWASHYFYN